MKICSDDDQDKCGTLQCDGIKVKGASNSNADCNGEYLVLAMRDSNNKPLYKHVHHDRYIYPSTRGHGWTIGSISQTLSYVTGTGQH